MARTPVPIGHVIGSRASGLSDGGLSGADSSDVQGLGPSIGSAEAIDDAAEQRVADRHRQRAAARHDAIAGPDAGGVAERHGQQAAVAEADDFNRQRRR